MLSPSGWARVARACRLKPPSIYRAVQMQPVAPDRMPGERKLEGLSAYDAALDELLANATHTVRIFDKTLGRNFNALQRYELLAEFLLARRTNRVRIVLHETANIVRDCPSSSVTASWPPSSATTPSRSS